MRVEIQEGLIKNFQITLKRLKKVIKQWGQTNDNKVTRVKYLLSSQTN